MPPTPHPTPAPGHDERRKNFVNLSVQNLIQTVAVIVSIIVAYGNLRSDTRDNTTRIGQSESAISRLQATQDKDRDENSRLLRELNGKIDRLLGQMEAKKP